MKGRELAGRKGGSSGPPVLSLGSADLFFCSLVPWLEAVMAGLPGSVCLHGGLSFLEL
jgi:hypothetical protein